MAKKGMDRRNFLKTAGIAAGALGATTMMPKVVKQALADEEKKSFLIGRPIPMKGPIAAFSEAAPWQDERLLKIINKDGGVFIKELNKKLPVEVKIVDTESNPAKAADLGSKLILKDKVDLMYVSSTPATCAPVSAVCERYEVPCIATNMPIEMWLPGGPYKWAFCASISVPDLTTCFLDTWSQLPTNKVIGLCAQNDADGVAWAQSAATATAKAGYKTVDPGRFPEGTKDYSALVQAWKKANVEILFSNMAPPDFNNMWRQCYQMGWLPKICTAGKSALFASAVESLGPEIGAGLNVEVLWHADFPYKSSLNGETGRQLADAYEAEFKKQYSQPLGNQYSGYEIIADVLKRAQTLDKKVLRDAIAATNMVTMQGPTKFDDRNAAPTPAAVGQWVKGKKYMYECVLVATTAKDIPLTSKLISIADAQKKG